MSGVKLSALVSLDRPLSFVSALFGCTIDFRYYPGVFTPEYENVIEANVLGKSAKNVAVISTPTSSLAEAADSEAPTESPAPVLVNYTVEMVSGLLASLGITDDNGIEFPPTPNNVAKIPYPILHGMFKAIKDDMIPKEKS